MRIHGARRANRLLHLVEIGERFEDEEIGAAFPERGHLLAKRRAGFVARGRTVGLESDAERADGAGDEHVLPRRLARELRRTPVDLPHLRLEAVLRELDAVCAERVRLQHLGAGIDVRAVDAEHEVGRAQVELVVALIDEDAALVQHRAHRAIEDDDAIGIEQRARVAALDGGGGHGRRDAERGT